MKDNEKNTHVNADFGKMDTSTPKISKSDEILFGDEIFVEGDV